MKDILDELERKLSIATSPGNEGCDSVAWKYVYASKDLVPKLIRLARAVGDHDEGTYSSAVDNALNEVFGDE